MITNTTAPSAGPRMVPTPPMAAMSTKEMDRSNPSMSFGSMKLKYDAYSPPEMPTIPAESTSAMSWWSAAETPQSAAASTSDLMARSFSPNVERRIAYDPAGAAAGGG